MEPRRFPSFTGFWPVKAYHFYTALFYAIGIAGDHRWASPGHGYSTDSVRQMPGLNLYLRQLIPGLSMLPWRMEATADLRNMLAQGYLSLGIVGGQQLLLVENPRSVRGGLSFIF